MGTIRVLPRQLADKIAAGEVCERPASVAKELIENSLDAGAHNIILETESGGLRLIRVCDDGYGMDSDDAVLCFSRHATSKLPSDNLDFITTMGFRGEALAAISAVSKIDLCTRRESAVEGTEIICEGGEVLSVSPAGCPSGTIISVKDLFYNTPARLKFMKKDSSESALLQGVIEKAAFARPDVSFKMIRDGREVLHTPGDNSLLTCIYCIYGREYASLLLPFSYEYNGVSAKGYACKPSAGRGNRSMQYFSVNSRPIKNRLLSAAIDEAYRNAMPGNKFASCFIDISISPSIVDVNIHPAKSEVKFFRDKDVFDCIFYGIKSMINKYSGIDSYPSDPVIQSTPPSADPPAAGSDFMSPDIVSETKNTDMPVFPFSYKDRVNSSAIFGANNLKVAEPSVSTYDSGSSRGVSEIRFSDSYKNSADPYAGEAASESESESFLSDQENVNETYGYKCEIFKTYIIAEGPDDIYIIDKHAAHERIIYEKLLSQEGRQTSQYLLSPVNVSLSAEEFSAVLAFKDEIESIGFEFEDFGGRSVLIRRIPEEISGNDGSAVFVELAQSLIDGKHGRKLSVRERLLYSVACRAAMKGGNINAQGELEAIISRVLELNDIRYCPHGRPVAYKITRSDLERRFGR